MKLKQKVKNLGIASLIFLNSCASFGCNSNVSFQDTAQTSKQQEVQKNNESSKNPSKKLEELVNTQAQQHAQTVKPVRMNQIPANVLTVSEAGGQGMYTSIVDALLHSLEGYEIWVSEGRYFEPQWIPIYKGQKVFGGFSKDFLQKDINKFPTVTDGSQNKGYPCVDISSRGTIDGMIIENCDALDGSAIMVSGGEGEFGGVIITNNTIRNNRNGENGEGSVLIHVFYDGNLRTTITNNKIYNNIGGRGTGVYISVDGQADGRNLTAKLDAIIESNEIYSNTNQSTGSGIQATISNYAKANIVIRNNKIRGNQSGTGGGVSIETGNPESQLGLTIEDNEISRNIVTAGGSGGAIEIFNLSDFLTVTIKGNLIDKNQAGFMGGGMYISSLSVNPPTINISGNVISNNVSGSWGGGIYSQGNINLNLFNNLMSYNTAVGNPVNDAAGGALYTKGGLITLVNNTIYGNKAVGRRPHGGGAYLESLASITNSIIRGNLLEASLTGYGEDLYAASDVSASYSNINKVIYSDGEFLKPDGSYASSNMVNVDPVFDNLESFVLSSDSPMVDAGDPLRHNGCNPPGKSTTGSGIGWTEGEFNCNIRMPLLIGDINGDGYVNVGDAVLGLQVLSGKQPLNIRPNYATSGADVNGDGRIGFPEVLYPMQKAAGMR